MGFVCKAFSELLEGLQDFRPANEWQRRSRGRELRHLFERFEPSDVAQWLYTRVLLPLHPNVEPIPAVAERT